MRIDLYYNPEREEYVFTSQGYELRLDREDFNHIKKSPSPLLYQLFKDR